MIPRVSGEGNSTSLSAPTTSTTTPTDNDNNNTIMQPHQQANDLYGQSSSSSYGGGGGSSSRLSSRGGAGNNNNSGFGGGGGGGYPDQLPHQQPPAGSSTRRFTISAGPEMILNDSSTSASQQQQQHQVPMHGGAGLPTSGSGNNDLLGVSHSQRGSQQHSFNGRGGSLGTGDDLQQQQQQSTTSPGNNNNNNSYYGSNNEPLSPTHLAHRMSLGFYPMSGGSTGSHNNFGGGLDPLDLSGRGGPGGVGGGPPAMGNGVPLTQADREEELLLNLLIARRQRGRVAGGDGKRGSQSSLADDLLRLRQNRASLMTTSSSTGGGGGASSSSSSSQQQSNYHGYNQHQQPHHQQQSHHHQQQQMQHHSSSSSRGGGGGGGMPQLPGMPPLYADILPGTGVSSNMYPGSGMDVYHSGSGSGGGGGGRMSAKSEGAGGSLSSHQRQQMRQIQDVAERIDRSPGRFHISDARMSEMRELSERGFKRGLGSMGMGSGNMGGMGGHLSSSGMGMGMGMGGGGGFDSGVGSGAFSYTPNMEDMGPPTKKKRTHKKKPADMPRRPLSAYNLFFSEERERILKEINKDSDDKVGDDEDDAPLIKEGDDDAGDEKPKAVERPLIPSQKKRRPHRKTHGKISFQQLARMVGERWKGLPDDERKYYQELAQEDMKQQKVAMEEYYAKQNTKDKPGGDMHKGLLDDGESMGYGERGAV